MLHEGQPWPARGDVRRRPLPAGAARRGRAARAAPDGGPFAAASRAARLGAAQRPGMGRAASQGGLRRGWGREIAALETPPPVDLRVNRLKATRRAGARGAGRARASRPSRCAMPRTACASSGASRSSRARPSRTAWSRSRTRARSSWRRWSMPSPACRSPTTAPAPAARPWRWPRGMNNKGRVVAMDVLRNAARPLGAAPAPRRRAQCRAPRRSSADNRKWLKRQAGAFDRVLVDAPCTGTGTWRRNPDGRWTLRPQDLDELVPKQAAILDARGAAGEAGRRPGLRHLLGAAGRERAARSRPSSSAIRSSRSCRSADVWRDALAASRRRRSRPAPTCACRRCGTAPTASSPPTLVRKRRGSRRRRRDRASAAPAASDAAAIGRVHVETWQSAYAGLLPDTLLAAMSDVRQSAWWSRALADPRRGARHLRGRRRGHGRGRASAAAGRCAIRPRASTAPRSGSARSTRSTSSPTSRTAGWAAACSTRCSASSRPTAATPPCCGCWPTTRRASSTRAWAASGSASASTRWRGSDVEEVAYAWRDLDAPLVRRRLRRRRD